jgi:hypothetical protein
MNATRTLFPPRPVYVPQDELAATRAGEDLVRELCAMREVLQRYWSKITHVLAPRQCWSVTHRPRSRRPRSCGRPQDLTGGCPRASRRGRYVKLITLLYEKYFRNSSSIHVHSRPATAHRVPSELRASAPPPPPPVTRGTTRLVWKTSGTFEDGRRPKRELELSAITTWDIANVRISSRGSWANANSVHG